MNTSAFRKATVAANVPVMTRARKARHHSNLTTISYLILTLTIEKTATSRS